MARKLEATQRWTMAASRQRHTRRVRNLTPACGLSMRLVVARQRCSEAGSPSRLMVKHSSRPSRKLAAAAGQSRSNHWANFSSLALPVFGSNRQAARIAARTWSRSGSGNRSRTLPQLVGAAALHRLLGPEHGADRRPQGLRAVDHNSRFWAGCTPRRTKPSSKSWTAAAFSVAPLLNPQHVLVPFRIHAHSRNHVMVAKHHPVDVEDQQLYFLEAAVQQTF